MSVVFPNITVTETTQGRGLASRRSVKVATTTSGSLSTSFAAGQLIDGITLVLDDRILIKNQTNLVENGIYSVTSGTPMRTLDLDEGTDAALVYTVVERGQTNAFSWWLCIFNANGNIVNTNPLLFMPIIGGGAELSRVHYADTATTTSLATNPSIASITYNPTNGVPPTGNFTGTLAVSDTLTIDGITYTAANNNSRILIKNENVQINRILTVADVGGSLNNTYFLISSPTTNYYVWYNVSGGGVDPSPGGTGIAVALITNDTATAVRDKTETAMTTTILNMLIERMPVPTNGINISANGTVTNPSDGGTPTGFTFQLITAGNASSNGLYFTTISGTSLTLSRAFDLSVSSLVNDGRYIVIARGNINHDTTWQLVASNPITVGTASGSRLLFIQNSANISVFPSNVVIGINAAPALNVGSMQNVIVGNNSGQALTIGRQNTIVGDNAYSIATNGQRNTTMGTYSMQNATNAALDCVAFGYQALNNVAATNNAAVGNNALQNLVGGSFNTALGNGAGLGFTSGSNNTILGYQAGTTASTGTGNTIIGSLANLTADNTARNYCIILGQTAQLIESANDAQLVIGRRGSSTRLTNVRIGPDLLLLRQSTAGYSSGGTHGIWYTTVSTNGSFAAKCTTTVFRSGAAGQRQMRIQRWYCVAMNNAGTLTTGISTGSGGTVEAAALESGTLTVTAAFVDAGGGNAEFQLTPTSSLGDSIVIRYKVSQLSSNDENELFDGQAP